MMLDASLVERKAELESDIAAIELALRPLERDLATKREEYQLVSKLVAIRSGPSVDTEAPGSETGPGTRVRFGPMLRLSEAMAERGHSAADDDLPVFAEYHGIWADICEREGWPTGKDSAHRVVIREDSEVHSRVAHDCPYDARRTPERRII